MPDVYAFEPCPFRDAAHAVADRSPIVRRAVHVLWPAARRAERVELSEEGIDAWTLTGRTHLSWSEVTDVEPARTVMGRPLLRIRGETGCIDVAPVLPGFEELESRVHAGCSAFAVA
jgi:hypothetical protein